MSFQHTSEGKQRSSLDRWDDHPGRTSMAKGTSKSPRAKRTAENQKKILDYLKDNGRSGCAEIAGYIGLSAARTRAILSEMKEVEAI